MEVRDTEVRGKTKRSDGDREREVRDQEADSGERWR